MHIPRESVKSDWEVELGVVTGAAACCLESPSDASERVAGYVLTHDVSGRELQTERGGQWDKGKSSESFNPLRPGDLPVNAGPPARVALGLANHPCLRAGDVVDLGIDQLGHVRQRLTQA